MSGDALDAPPSLAEIDALLDECGGDQVAVRWTLDRPLLPSEAMATLRRHQADGFLHQQAVERRGAAAKARAAARREREREAEPPALPIPRWATARQRAVALAAAHDLRVREKASKVERRWEAVLLHHAPPGCVAVATLIGGRMVRLCVDGSGALRVIEGGRPGALVSVAEACALAAGR